MTGCSENIIKKILVISCLGMLYGAAQAGQIPVEDFAKADEFYDAVLSPGGEYIAVERAAERGKSLVAVLQTKDLKLLSHIPATSGPSPVNPRWIRNNRLVVEFMEGSKQYEEGWNWRNGECWRWMPTAGLFDRLSSIRLA
jgi:hypothetical protein